MWPVYLYFLFTVRKRSCGKVMFYTCLSVILFTGGDLPQCKLGYTPFAPLGPETPPRTRGRHPPGPEADTPLSRPSQQTPPSRYPSQADTPPQTPPGQTPPSRRLLLRTIRILLECILVCQILLLPMQTEIGGGNITAEFR